MRSLVLTLIPLLTLLVLISGCDLFQGIRDGITGEAPASAEMDLLAKEIMDSYDEYQSLKTALQSAVEKVNAATEDDTISDEELLGLKAEAERLRAAYLAAKARYEAIMAAGGKVIIKKEESGTSWLYTAGSAIGGALMTFLGMKYKDDPRFKAIREALRKKKNPGTDEVNQ